MIKKSLSKYSTLWVILILLCLYEISVKKELIDSFLFPPIEKIILIIPKYMPLMIENLVGSFSLLIPGVFISIVLGILVGVLMGSLKNLYRTMNPIFNAISPLPATLLTPYAIHIFADFRKASIFIIAFGTFWPIFNATMNGVMTIDKRYLDKAATVEIKGWQKLVRVILPGAAPQILTGMISAIRASFVLLVVAEMYGVSSGMGFFVQRYAGLGSFTQAALGFVVLSLSLVCFLQLLEYIKKRMLHWTLN